MNDSYYTLAKAESCEIKVKGSRFIGYVRPAKDIDEAEDFIQTITKKHYDATHNCFAYRVGLNDKSRSRFSDDGEPSGTAGRPILEAIDGRQLTDSVCVVTRYYGGTKLGTGGLSRAYGECAGLALDKAGKVQQFLTDSVRIIFPYDMTGPVMTWVERLECRVQNTLYGNEVTLDLHVRLSRKESLIKQLSDATAGKIRFASSREDAC